ncbi:MAG: FAD synthetase family protein [Rikenellaceae bacterium]
MIHHISEITKANFQKGLTATIGSYDGIHTAHREIIAQLVEKAKISGTESAIITFEPHPRVEIEGENSSLRILTTLEEKDAIISNLGVDYIIVLKFDSIFRALTANEFCNSILIDKLNVKTLFVGFDNKIGSDRVNSCKFFSSNRLIEIVTIDQIAQNEKKIGSTTVRNLICSGDILAANMLLEIPYFIRCKIDFNSKLIIENRFKLLPPKGEYRCQLTKEGENKIYGETVNLTINSDNKLIINKIFADCMDYNSYYIVEFIEKSS